MRNIKLTESNCIFIHYALRMYAKQNTSIGLSDKSEIRKLAAKFK